MSEKFSSRFYATSHRTEVAHLELELDFFVQFIVYFHIVANQVFDLGRPFLFEQASSRNFLLGGMISCICSTEHACVCCVLCRLWWLVTTEGSRSNVIKRCRVWQNSKSIQKCHRTLVRGHAILPSYEVVATLILWLRWLSTSMYLACQHVWL